MTTTKKLGLFDSVLLVSGSMIGSGIFLVTGDMTRQLGNGPLVLLAWILTGVITLMAALSFGELAAMMPNAGGQYNFITRIYGKRMGFVYGWAVFSVIQTGVIAAVAMAFAKHLGIFVWGHDKVVTTLACFGYRFSLLSGQCMAIASIVLLTGINSLGNPRREMGTTHFYIGQIGCTGGPHYWRFIRAHGRFAQWRTQLLLV